MKDFDLSEFARSRASHLALMTEKARLKNKGANRTFSDEHRKNLSEAAKKRIPKKGDQTSGWRGDEVGYGGIHIWMAREFGSPRKCDHCNCDDASTFDWANKSGDYLRDRSDWLRLCRSCHTKYDKRGYQSTLLIEFDGKEMPLKEWASVLGIKYITLYSRLYVQKKSVEEAFTSPVNRKPKSKEKHRG